MISDMYDKRLISESGYRAVIQSYYYNEWTTYEMQQHLHDRIEIMYVIKGDCIVRYRQDKIKLFSGDFIIINAGTPHALSIDNPRGCMILNIEFLFEQFESAAPDFAVMYQNCDELRKFIDLGEEYFRIKDNGEIYRILFSALENIDITAPNRFSFDLWMSLLVISIARLAVTDSDKSTDDYIQKAKDYIAHNYFREIRVNDISDFIHIHPAYLQRLFKKECGMSVIDYITNYRMKKAYYLLSRTNMSIMDIANSVGINSQQYFTRLFKKSMDITPKALRDSKSSDNPEIDPMNNEIDWTWRSNLAHGESKYDNDPEWLANVTDDNLPGNIHGYKK